MSTSGSISRFGTSSTTRAPIDTEDLLAPTTRPEASAALDGRKSSPSAPPPTPASMNMKRAQTVLQKAFAKVDALGEDATRKGAGDGELTRKKLSYASRSDALTQEEREACAYLAEHRVAFDLTDKSGDNNPGSGSISLADLDHALGHTLDGKAPKASSMTDQKRAAPTTTRPGGAAPPAATKSSTTNPPPMDRKRAQTVLQKAFAKVDALGEDDTRKGAGDGKLSQKKLAYASQSKALTEEERQACKHLAEHKVDFDLTDMGGPGNFRDGFITLADLDNELGKTADGKAPKPSGMTEKRATEIILDQFHIFEALGPDGKGKKLLTGTMGLDELKAAAQAPGLSPELKAAAKFFVDHPLAWRALDGANDGGTVDGVIARRDAEIHAARASDQPEATAPRTAMGKTPREAMEIIEASFDLIPYKDKILCRDGPPTMDSIPICTLRTTDDLKRASEDPALSPELRDALKFLIDNPKYLEMADGGAGPVDGLFRKKDFTQILPLLK